MATRRPIVLVSGVISELPLDDSITPSFSELPVSLLQDGAARQLLQTDAAGTGVEWTSNVDVPGTLGVTGQSTLASAAVSDLTNGRVVLAGTSGELEDSAALTFNGTQLDVDGNVVITGGKSYRINNTEVLTSTTLGSGVTESSLTSVGTISTGVWEGTPIAGTKVTPDFGTQNIVTTGTATAAALIPSGSSKPTYGFYLTSANNVAVSTASTRRMTIKQDGSLVFGDFDTATSTASGGKAYIDSNSTLYVAVGGGTVAYFNRNTDDGEIVGLRQGNVTEGSISVSGTTVTYGGGHLARWSQLPNNEDPSTLLKGTVMSNLNDMCQWENEDNEQLNKTKVSDVEGDPNVAGVFVSTSFSEDGPLDFFVGMTGDMVIRIGAGVTVERGDLLMSAGDGTAKPQDDDIIRSKTIAKVTSTNVSCTHPDGSYCVPCVLMAC